MANKDFLYGLSKMSFKGSVIGYIEKDSFDWGGKGAEKVEIYAEQVPSAPVLVLQQKNGTIAPKFNMIQMNYQNMAALLGGKATTTGWEAPSELITLSGPWEIETPSGKKIVIKNGNLTSNLAGKLTLTEVSKIACEIEVLAPEDGSSPYSIVDMPGK